VALAYLVLGSRAFYRGGTRRPRERRPMVPRLTGSFQLVKPSGTFAIRTGSRSSCGSRCRCSLRRAPRPSSRRAGGRRGLVASLLALSSSANNGRRDTTGTEIPVETRSGRLPRPREQPTKGAVAGSRAAFRYIRFNTLESYFPRFTTGLSSSASRVSPPAFSSSVGAGGF
jgi:hypothetical protein